MEKKIKILIVDDSVHVREGLKQTFMDLYELVFACSGKEALEKLKSNPDIATIVLDIKMAEMDGLESAEQIRKVDSDIPIIFHTGYPGDYSETQVENECAPYDYVTKNDSIDRLMRAVKNAVAYHGRLISHFADLIEWARTDHDLVGKSMAMLDVYRKIEQYAPTDNKIMILGPSGTGKELVAKAIHKRSKRAEGRFGILNCNHKDPGQVEAELFGHHKDVFTGVGERTGLFEFADGGTLFLDEIGDLDITTQGKLLRAVESGKYQKAGKPDFRHTDVRIICATHRDLEQGIKAGTFREDLYYRLFGVVITLPPLNERREDIPELVEYFIEKHYEGKNEIHKKLTWSAIEALIEYDWSGNVRHLETTVKALLDHSPSMLITRDDVVSYLKIPPREMSGEGSLKEQMEGFERILIVKALARHDNNIAAASRALVIDPAFLRKKMRKYGINRV